MIFVGEAREYKRESAQGYKGVVFESAIGQGDNVDFFTKEDHLSIEKDTDNQDLYLVATKEIGVFGKNYGVEAEIDVVFCDGGYMFVTLRRGSMAIRTSDDKLAIISVNDTAIESVPQFDANREILWKSTDDLLAYKEYWGDKSGFVFDFQFRLHISGHGSDFRLKLDKECCIDISLGVYAQYVAMLEAAASQQRAREIAKNFSNKAKTVTFDEDDYVDFDEEDDDDDEEEFEDVL